MELELKTCDFFKGYEKLKEIKFDYEVQNLKFENEENLISKMYYHDENSKKDSNKIKN
jgi:hypothetical protein